MKVRTAPDDFKPAEIPKSSTEQLRVGIGRYNGREYVDIRVYYRGDDGWAPSNKGVTLPFSQWGAFRRAVVRLGQELRARGLWGQEDDEELEEAAW